MSEFQFSPPDQFEHVRARIAPLFELEGDAFEAASAQLLGERLAELCAPPAEQSLSAIDGNFQGFIQPETTVLPHAIGLGYRLDDPTLYTEAFSAMRHFYRDALSAVGDPVRAYRAATLLAAQHVQQEYFGTVRSGEESKRQHSFLLADFSEEDTPSVRSIVEFKGLAQCAERAAVVNNVMQLFGVQPVLEMGWLHIDGEAKPELHAYLFFVSSKGEEFVHDPNNPSLVFNDEGELLQVIPATYPAGDALTTRDHTRMIPGGPKEYVFDGQEKHLTRQSTHGYQLNLFGSELHPQ